MAQSPPSPRSPPHVTSPTSHDKGIISAADSSPLEPQAFKPFFTIVADDKATSARRSSLDTPVNHHHPHVYYIFSDDANSNADDVLTSALLDTLTARSGQAQAHAETSQESTEDANAKLERDARGRLAQIADAPQDERYIIVDMTADGRDVARVKSLSRDWQVVRTDVRPAPSFDRQGDDDHRDIDAKDNDKKEGGELMLWIEGREVDALRGDADGSLAQEGNEEAPLEKVERLRREFETEMSLLRDWVDSDSKEHD